MADENYIFLLSVAGFTALPVVLLNRMIGDDVVRRSLLVMVPFVPIMLAVGRIVELHIFGELLPVILMAFLWIVGEALRSESVA